METCLPRLAAPAGLQWGIEYPPNRTEDSLWVPSANHFSWRWSMEGLKPKALQACLFRRDGIRVLSANLSLPETGFSNFSCDWNSGLLFSGKESANPAASSLESGDYYFTVQALGDQTTCGDSDAARSEPVSYLRPLESLPMVKAVWGPDFQIQLLTPEIDDPCFRSYYVKLYREKEPQSRQFERFTSWSRSLPQVGSRIIALPPALLTPPFVRPGCRLAFQICAMSKDVTRCQNGPWSLLIEG